ncbi:MAG: DUF3299 domain-containing protein [Rudanella sp.]|nr:DUF3299 domain-containing protein [Rudanella sp.]
MRRITFLLFALLLTLRATGAAPRVITWEQLRDVQFRKRWYPEENVVMLAPRFGQSVKALSGNAITITITGYVIPVDLERGLYVVSRYPMAACFFCGGAGPESVMALNFKRLPRTFKTDERRTFSGMLRLNADNIYEMNYILDRAELVSDLP